MSAVFFESGLIRNDSWIMHAAQDSATAQMFPQTVASFRNEKRKQVPDRIHLRGWRRGWHFRINDSFTIPACDRSASVCPLLQSREERTKHNGGMQLV